MAHLSDFLNSLLPFVPQCSAPMAEQVLREVAQDFCNVTGIVVETLEPITIQPGRTLYDVDPPWNCEVARISNAWFKGVQLCAFSESQADSYLFAPASPGALIPQGYPTAIRLTGAKEFQINRMPLEESKDAVLIRAVLKPSKDAQSVPDILQDNYLSTIINGALSKLLKMPATFRDLNLAMYYENEYRRGRSAARIDANSAFGNVRLTAIPRRFR